MTSGKNKNIKSVCFLCLMQSKIDKIEEEIVQKIFKLALEKFDGNNSLFARKSNCSEASIRRIYNGKQRMTLNMLLKLCDGLDIDLKELIKNIDL